MTVRADGQISVETEIDGHSPGFLFGAVDGT